MPSKNSTEYWKQRALALEEAQHQAAADFNTTWDAEYQKATERLQKDFEYWYNRVAESDGISMADARKLLNADELAEFHWSLEEFIAKAKDNGDLQWEKQLVHASAKQHISRLEQEQIQMQNAVKDLFADRQASTADFLGSTYSDAYLQSHFSIQQHSGKGYIPRPIDTASLEKALSKPWAADGKTFSSRIWADQQKLTAELQTVLSQGLIRGDSPLLMSKELARRMNISQSNAARLVYTESAVFRERGSLDAMKSRGAKALEIIATLDSGTCAECGSMDGKKVDIKDAEVGVTIPTFHPRCRCTSAAYDPDFAAFEDENSRAARDAEGETFYVPASMTYEQWKEEQVKAETAAKDLKYGSENGIISLPAIIGGIKATVTMSVHIFEKAEQRGVSREQISDALLHPLHITDVVEDENGRPSAQYIGTEATVAVNPDTLVAPTTWPTGKARRKKYGRKR